MKEGLTGKISGLSNEISLGFTGPLCPLIASRCMEAYLINKTHAYLKQVLATNYDGLCGGHLAW